MAARGVKPFEPQVVIPESLLDAITAQAAANYTLGWKHKNSPPRGVSSIDADRNLLDEVVKFGVEMYWRGAADVKDGRLIV